MTKTRGVLLIIIVTALLMTSLSGCYLFPEEEEVLAPPLIEPPEITYETEEVKKGVIEKKVSASGTFVSIEQTTMFFRNRGGRLKEIHVKEGEFVEKGQLIAELDSGDLENQVKMQEIHLKKAQTRLSQVKSYSDDKYERRMAQYDVDLAKLTLDNLKRELNECKLTADISGNVVYIDHNVNQGDYVNAYHPLIRIADPTQLQLQVTGTNIGDFKLGMETEVTINKQTYTGKVVMTPAEVPIDVPDELREVVRIDVENIPEDVELGDTAQVNLILDRREDVIVIPRNLVRNYMGRKYVLVLENGLKVEKDVEVGLETPTQVEIKKGLEEGELLIVR
ncbi:MAG: efflux RND transporter periplasmic adaptor subunit [Caldicoprobacterales bacterium]